VRIGVIENAELQEYRVSLSPSGVHTLVDEGHTVLIETGAGQASGFSDTDYRMVGGEIVFTREEAIRRADLVLSVAPLTNEYCCMLTEEQIIMSFLHYGLATENVIKSLLKAEVTGIAYDMIEEDDGRLPILIAMSEIAGRIMPHIANYCLQSTHGGRGITLAGAPGIPSAKVVIIGAGVLGTAACHSFIGCGASVDVVDVDLDRLRKIEETFGPSVNTYVSIPYTLGKVLSYADVLVGAILTRSGEVPKLITEEMVKSMRKGAVIIDASIDQGGCVATSHPTTHSDPIFIKHSVVHCCIPNIPSTFCRTASYALNNNLLPLIRYIANEGLDKALKRHSSLKRGMYLRNGKITSETLAERFELR